MYIHPKQHSEDTNLLLKENERTDKNGTMRGSERPSEKGRERSVTPIYTGPRTSCHICNISTFEFRASLAEIKPYARERVTHRLPRLPSGPPFFFSLSFFFFLCSWWAAGQVVCVCVAHFSPFFFLCARFYVPICRRTRERSATLCTREREKKKMNGWLR